MLDSSIKWLSQDLFEVNGWLFRTISADFKKFFTTEREAVIIKPREMIHWYEKLIKERKPKNVLEFGIFQGGSELLFLALSSELRLLALDLSDPNDILDDIISERGGERVKLRFGVSQDDGFSIDREVRAHFGSEKLDLVIDDASHLYRPSRIAFENCFPRLRTGGLYVIEDWGWANWPGQWQEANGQWHDQVALTNLVFELIMVAGSRPDVISRLKVVSPDVVVVERGAAFLDENSFKLNETYFSRGKSLGFI